MISLEDLIRINQDGIQGISEYPNGCKIRVGLVKTITLNPDLGWYAIRHGYGHKQQLYFCLGGDPKKQTCIESDEIQVAEELPLFMTRDITKSAFRAISRFRVINMMTGEIFAEFDGKKNDRVVLEIHPGFGRLKHAKDGATATSFSFNTNNAPAPFINFKDLARVRQIARDRNIPCKVHPNCVTQITDGIYNIAYFNTAKNQRRDVMEVLRLDVFVKSVEEYRPEVMRIAKLDAKSMPDENYKVLFNQALLCKQAEDIIAINASAKAGVQR